MPHARKTHSRSIFEAAREKTQAEKVSRARGKRRRARGAVLRRDDVRVYIQVSVGGPPRLLVEPVGKEHADDSRPDDEKRPHEVSKKILGHMSDLITARRQLCCLSFGSSVKRRAARRSARLRVFAFAPITTSSVHHYTIIAEQAGSKPKAVREALSRLVCLHSVQSDANPLISRSINPALFFTVFLCVHRINTSFNSLRQSCAVSVLYGTAGGRSIDFSFQPSSSR